METLALQALKWMICLDGLSVPSTVDSWYVTQTFEGNEKGLNYGEFPPPQRLLQWRSGKKTGKDREKEKIGVQGTFPPLAPRIDPCAFEFSPPRLYSINFPLLWLCSLQTREGGFHLSGDENKWHCLSHVFSFLKGWHVLGNTTPRNTK